MGTTEKRLRAVYFSPFALRRIGHPATANGIWERAEIGAHYDDCLVGKTLMWESEEIRKPTDYSGLIIGLVSIPVYFLVSHFGDANQGLNAFVCFAVALLVIRIYWNFRTKIWFWLVIVVLLFLHIPLILKLELSHQGISRITLLPIGVADLLIYVGVIKLITGALSARGRFSAHSKRG